MNGKFFDCTKKILSTLAEHGFNAYIVGGAVRDFLLAQLEDKDLDFSAYVESNLNFDSQDIDITSNARPEDVIRIFDKTVPSGVDYGTVTIFYKGLSFEHTTFRRDLEYKEGTRSPVTEYADNLYEDVLRRDFSINALAIDLDFKVYDYCGGISDLEKGLIRCVGSPKERLLEDPLRKLRAIRFAAQKGFALEEKLKKTLKNDSSLACVSGERIRDELEKILVSKYPDIGLNLLASLGFISSILTELQATIGFDQKNHHHEFDVFTHIVNTVKNIPPNPHLRWAALFHDIGKPLVFSLDDNDLGHFYGHEKKSTALALDIMTRLKFSKADKKRIAKIISYHGSCPKLDKKQLRRWMSKVGENLVGDMICFFEADYISKKKTVSHTDYFAKLKIMTKEILSDKPVFSRKDLAVNGDDLIKELGLLEEDKKNLSKILDHLVKTCIDNPKANSKQGLIKISKEIIAAHRS